MSDLRRIHFAEIRDYLQGKRQIVHDRLAIHAPCTAIELAEAMQWDKTSIRPRITELHHAGLCEPTGERRNGEHVWRWVALCTAEARARAEATEYYGNGREGRWFLNTARFDLAAIGIVAEQPSSKMDKLTDAVDKAGLYDKTTKKRKNK